MIYFVTCCLAILLTLTLLERRKNKKIQRVRDAVSEPIDIRLGDITPDIDHMELMIKSILNRIQNVKSRNRMRTIVSVIDFVEIEKAWTSEVKKKCDERLKGAHGHSWDSEITTDKIIDEIGAVGKGCGTLRVHCESCGMELRWVLSGDLVVWEENKQQTMPIPSCDEYRMNQALN